MEDKHLRMKSELEQERKMIREEFCSLWWQVFEGSLEQGFSEQQAFELVKIMVKETCRKNSVEYFEEDLDELE